MQLHHICCRFVHFHRTKYKSIFRKSVPQSCRTPWTLRRFLRMFSLSSWILRPPSSASFIGVQTIVDDMHVVSLIDNDVEGVARPNLPTTTTTSFAIRSKAMAMTCRIGLLLIAKKQGLRVMAMAIPFITKKRRPTGH
ncbi:hypothetical protein CDAR_466031 [Caerostris darwini]|uniref:Uncharacterized protein n=1 Tax=Caerostris darwini TaxID=1538125 RepID=A0AAV4WLH0_9ARAC|nr:hypothetical protein CDAR_466031 [Caerostris darwini]